MSTPVPPVPEGYHTLQPYLTVRDAAKALGYYQELFNGVELVRMTMPGTDVLMHGELRIGDSVLMLSEEDESCGTRSPLALGGSPVNVMVYVAQVDTVFAKAIAAGCQPLCPPTDMFWGDRFCKFTDPFAHIWAVATHIKDPTPEEFEAGRQAMCGG